MTGKIFSPPNHCLRFLFLVALVRVRAFLFYHSEYLCHVFHFVPNIKAHEDRRGLLSGHCDTIAGPRIDLDDLLLLRFVLRAEDSLAKYVPPFRSFTITLSIFAPSARNMFANRSWVRGRSFCMPCMNIVIAAPTL